jgi:hypothetical protein
MTKEVHLKTKQAPGSRVAPRVPVLAAALAALLTPGLGPWPGPADALAQNAAGPRSQPPGQDPVPPPSPPGGLEAFFLSQPPLKASEIPAAREALRLASRDASNAQIDALAGKHGISLERLDFVVTKVSAAMVLIARPGDAEAAARAAGTRAALPTPAEMELVRPHYDALAEHCPGLTKPEGPGAAADAALGRRRRPRTPVVPGERPGRRRPRTPVVPGERPGRRGPTPGIWSGHSRRRGR